MHTDILILDAHPNPESFCAALADAALAGARSTGASASKLELRHLQFDPILRAGYRDGQALEPDLLAAQAAIAAARHLILVYPSWWGTWPALLKGFVDRAFTPGFAFRYHPEGNGWDKLLAGRSARVVVTMDWPVWAYHWLQGAPGNRAMSRATLGFCGVKPVRFTELGPVRPSTPEQRAAWLAQVRRVAAADARPHARAAVAGATAPGP